MVLQYARKSCTRTFYTFIMNRYPILKIKKDYRRMFQFLLYGTFIDKDTERKIITAEMLAKIEGVTYNGRYVAESFLNAFQHDVLPDFKWTKYDYEKGKARQVLDLGLPKDVQIAFWTDVRTDMSDEERVYFDTGEKLTKRSQGMERTRLREVTKDMKTYSEVGDLLIDYLNSLPANIFNQQVKKYYSAALVKLHEVVNEIDDEHKRNDVLIQQSITLQSIYDQCQVFYQPGTGISDRIWPLTVSMLNLKSEVRRALTQDWIELDLRSAHLAIFGAMWNIKEVNDFLRTGKSIWRELLDVYGLPLHAHLKDELKTALYSICYGKKASLVAESITRFGKSVRANKVFDTELALRVNEVFNGDTFINHPAIASLIAARDNAIKDIKKHKGGATCLGRWISTDDYPPISIISAQAQAYELLLVSPMYELAKANQWNFAIPLHEHDGVSICVFRGAETEEWIKQISQVVKDKAQELGILTELEVK